MLTTPQFSILPILFFRDVRVHLFFRNDVVYSHTYVCIHETKGTHVFFFFFQDCCYWLFEI